MSTTTVHGCHKNSWKIDYLVCEGAGTSTQHALKVPVLVSTDGDNQTQWKPGERLHHLFEYRCKSLGWRARRKKTAVEYPNESYSYAALDKLSNQLVRFLRRQDVKPGARIALMIDRSIYSHAVVLAISRIGAAYVPLDASFPADRINFILKDSNVSLVLTLTQFMGKFSNCVVPALSLDAHRDEIDNEKSAQVRASFTDAADSLCYIIYTSGTTGRPKGVPIRHSNICNFLHVAKDTYKYLESDRVYQGMTIAFDYSIEELWVPLCAGATLVPAPSDGNLVGEDLADFIRTREITAICCVPTLLETIESDLPLLRFMMVSGEACPAHLAKRWNHGDRRFLNTYGPTETTVSATWLPLGVNDEITIGGPLPTYTIVILSENSESGFKVEELGEIGEICIAGIGLAEGYIGLPDQTNHIFIEDFIGISNNPSGKIYRTGDLGRINSNNQIEFRGRVDTQVKIRGYRIELDEIEASLLEYPEIDRVVVNPYKPADGNIELVAYYCANGECSTHSIEKIHASIKERLPAYMVPAFFEQLSNFPTLASGKLDRKGLPVPSGNRMLSSGKTYIAPETKLEADLAGQMAAVLQVDVVSTDANFFDDLGANSLLIAQFVANLRKNMGVKRLSLKKIYQHPTIQQLAEIIDVKQPVKTSIKPVNVSAAITSGTTASKLPLQDAQAASAQVEQVSAVKSELVPWIASKFDHILCGVLQTICYVALFYISTYMLIAGYLWIEVAPTILGVMGRSMLFGTVLFFGTSALLIAVKWLAVGRFDENKVIKLWSIDYLRFWIARAAVRGNPLNLARGTVLYSWYLRMLGARIGNRVTYLATTPTCVDLLTIGDDTLIREDAQLPGYHVLSGYVKPGRITIGSGVYIGEATVLDINTSIGDNAQVGTSSSLHENQTVLGGKSYQGSPAVECATNFNRVPALEYNEFSRSAYVIYNIATGILFGAPLSFAVAKLLISSGLPELSVVESSRSFSEIMPYLLILSVALYFGALLSSLASVMIIPRLIRPFLILDKVHPLFGVQYHLAGMMTRFSNSQLLSRVFGDSSLILHYLRFLGYDMSEATQTGSNFGVEQQHDSPFLCKFSRNTLVSDGLRLMNIDLSNTSFKISQINMPADTYLGNRLHYPVDSKIGENCLIATKAMIPIDGPMREGVGILGSPPFEIPRSVMRDQKFDHFKEPSVLRQRLKMKLRSNLWTLSIFMLQYISIIFISLCATWSSWKLFENSSLSSAAIAGVGTALGITLLLVFIFWTILAERVAQKFKPMKPLYCSLYDRAFWDHERFWKMSAMDNIQIFAGTPMISFFHRLRSMKVGRMFFDDGAAFPEPGLVKIGDHCCFNAGSVIQSHSLEDGAFKSDFTHVGSGCNFGVAAFIHYSVQIDCNATVLADSFVMKGSYIEQGSTWGGNPAKELVSQFDALDIAQIKVLEVPGSWATNASTGVSKVHGMDHETKKQTTNKTRA